MSDDRTPGDGPGGPPPGWGPPPQGGRPPQGGQPPYGGQPPQQGGPGPWGPPPGGGWNQPGPGQPGPYGPPPGWGQQPGPQQGWGQQPPPPAGWGPPPGAPGPGGPGPSGSNRRLWILVGAGVAAVVLLVAAVVVGITQLGGEDGEAGPSDEPTSGETEEGGSADGPMSAAAADELRERLEEQDWTCYDSLDEPVEVKRCFVLKPGDEELSTPVRGQLTLQYQDDAVGSARFRVNGATGASAIAPLVEATATTIGETLFDDQGSELAALASEQSAEPQDVDGARVTGNGAGLDAYVEDFDFAQPESPALPPVEEAQTTLTGAGYSCAAEGELVTCEVERDAIRLRVSSSSSSDIGWSVTVSPADFDSGASLEQGLAAAAEMFGSIGVVGDDGAAWIRENPVDGSVADIGGHELSIIRSEVGDGTVFNAIISVRPIR